MGRDGAGDLPAGRLAARGWRTERPELTQSRRSVAGHRKTITVADSVFACATDSSLRWRDFIVGHQDGVK